MQQSSIENSVIAFLRTRSPSAISVELNRETPLLNNAALDSLGVLELMMFLSEKFEVEVEDLDFQPANFETVGHLADFIGRKKAFL